MNRRYRSYNEGVTLIEILIVIALLVLLLQIMLPAIQSAREAARRTECANHLKQIAMAAQSHESSHGFFPSGGWGRCWIGDADRGTGKSQPGSWAYQLLPFVEAQSVHDIGLRTKDENKMEALAILASTPVALFYCPTRRSPTATPNRAIESDEVLFWYNANRADMLARIDYAGNIGDHWRNWSKGPVPKKAEAFVRKARPLKDLTGVIVRQVPIYSRQITDGLSKTYFVGEKSLIAEQYDTGTNHRDDGTCWSGDASDTVASTQWPPTADAPSKSAWSGDLQHSVRFGSAHANGFNAALCDGSVQFIGYDIDPQIHKRFGNRKDE